MKKKRCVICGEKFEPDTEYQYACSKCIKTFDIGKDVAEGYIPPGPIPEVRPTVEFVIMPESKSIFTSFNKGYGITNNFLPTKRF